MQHAGSTGLSATMQLMADPSPANRSFLENLLKWWPLLLFFLGGLLTQLWTSYRNRTRKFKWQAWHNQIAMAANNPALGNVTVQHNGVNVNHIHATTVEFRNGSNQDVTNVLVTLSFQGVGHVIDTTGAIDNTPLYLDPAYMGQLVNAPNAAQIQILNSAIEYRIPVLNRRKSAFFHMLVHRDNLTAPIVIPSCNYAGFRLEQMKQPAVVLFGISQRAAAYVGLLVSTPIVAALLWKFHHPYIDGVFAYILGLAVAATGALVIKAGRVLDRIFG
jgi:hypothetical protein